MFAPRSDPNIFVLTLSVLGWVADAGSEAGRLRNGACIGCNLRQQAQPLQQVQSLSTGPTLAMGPNISNIATVQKFQIFQIFPNIKINTYLYIELVFHQHIPKNITKYAGPGALCEDPSSNCEKVWMVADVSRMDTSG